VARLLGAVCDEPSAVQQFFPEGLPADAARARIAFWRYRFTTPEERRASGLWWTRERVGATRPQPCRTGD
jgi:hypothetical protein